jgi:hypothetical protein
MKLQPDISRFEGVFMKLQPGISSVEGHLYEVIT